MFLDPAQADAMRPITRVHNLCKRYRIGQIEPYRTLRESIVRSFTAPARAARSMLGDRVRGGASSGVKGIVNVSGPRSRKLVALLCLEVIALNIIFLPSTMNFNLWAFYDQGANLVVQYLIRAGYRPAVDFTYHYGLLPLLFGRVWFDAFGMTPMACLAAMALCALAVAWALARVAQTGRIGWPGVVLFLVALPFAIPLPAPNLAHALEAALLSNALAEQLAGRYRRALALTAASSFAKPSMAYVYGFILLTFVVKRLRLERRLGLRPLMRVLLPAVITEAALTVVLGITYSPGALVSTLVPITGMRLYRTMHFGFFYVARHFWYFPGVHLGYYIGTVAGFWIAATIWLAVCGAAALSRARNSRGADTLAEEVVLSCGLLQLSFIFFFFGGFFSWFYYVYLLLIGVALSASWGAGYRYVIWGLVLMAAVGQKAEFAGLYSAWRDTSPSPETANLWVSPVERSEWAHVLGIVKGQQANGASPAAILDVEGAAELLFPGFASPVSLYLVPGAIGADAVRKLGQLSEASLVIVPKSPIENPVLHDWPILTRALTKCTVVWKGRFFDVYRESEAGTLPVS